MLTRLLNYLLLIAGSLHAQRAEPVNTLTSEQLDSQQLQLVYALARQLPEGAQVAVALFDGDRTHYYGALREANQVTETDNRARGFAIGSVSKVFTATLLADAVDRGLVTLNDSVSKAYDFPFADGIDFTYEQLADHTSGLPRLPNNISGALLHPQDPYSTYTPKKLESYLQKGLSIHKPGQSAYSNLGFGLLAYTLTQRLEKTSYAAALEERIFTPLGMTHSSVGPDSSRAELVQGYKENGKKDGFWHFTEAMTGAGSIVSTTEDMVRFLRAQADSSNVVLALTREIRVETSEREGVGLGWQIIKTTGGSNLYWHNGAVGGYRSFVAIYPERETGVVLLTNTLFDGDEVDAAGFDLFRTLIKK